MANKFSLHIGLNTVDPQKYKSKYRVLRNAENDTTYYQSIAAGKGFDTTILLGKDATSDNLLSATKQLSKKLKSGDLFFLTYSGHGSRVKDLNNDEPDGYDEVLVLFDRLFIDDEFQNCWRLFPDNSKIFFVSDSCYNGTVSRFLNMDKNLRDSPSSNLFRGIAKSEAEADFNNHLGFYSSIKLLPENTKITCPLIHISACKDNQLADDGGSVMKNGMFTTKFREIYADGKFKGSYRSFFSALLSLMPAYQTPNWDTEAGADAALFEQNVLLE
jgi:metacaspase-1